MKTIKNLKAEEIRKSILQLAIQGKLVKQDPNDEPACELVKRIYVEKQKLIKEGKIKKDKNESFIFKGDDNCYYEKIGNNEPVKLEDLTFDIPDNWTWTRLKNIANITAGGTPDRGMPKYWNGKIPWLKISDITSSDKYVRKASEYITEDGMNNSSAKIMRKGTILYTIFATIGEVGILDIDATCNQAIAGLDTYDKTVNDFLYFILVNLQDYMKSISKGCAQFNINQKILKDAIIPLPPLEEQKRIVDKINSFEALLLQYELAETKLSLLEQKFPNKLKKSILQYAIEGKLVKQDPNDEPASILLERIKQEKERLVKEGKIKCDKNESYIYQGDDKKYYENLPKSWCVTTLSNISLLITKGTTPRGGNVAYLDKGIGFLRAENVIGYDKISQINLKYIDEKTHLNYLKRSILFEDDILITIAGTLGRTGLIRKQDLPLNTNQAISIIRIANKELTKLRYLTYMLNAPSIQIILTKQKKITAIPNLTLEIIADCCIPIAPINQQDKIINKLDHLFSLI